MTLGMDRLNRTLKTLDTFVDCALGLDYKGPYLSGFHYNLELLHAAVANTYAETVGSRADSLHLRIKQVPASSFYWEYLRAVGIVGTRFNLKDQEVVLAFDYTDEDFYGDVQGTWIYGWTGENAVTGKFKFLTCAIVSSDIPQKIPLVSIPVPVGHSMAREVCWCLALVKPMVKSIKLVLFDRGFYSKELMLTLADSEYPYLIFARKNDKIKRELEQMMKDEKKTIHYEFELNKDKTVIHGETTFAFLKQIFDKRTEKHFDWAFAFKMKHTFLPSQRIYTSVSSTLSTNRFFKCCGQSSTRRRQASRSFCWKSTNCANTEMKNRNEDLQMAVSMLLLHGGAGQQNIWSLLAVHPHLQSWNADYW